MKGGEVERVKGIEPSCEAWKASVLPLNYTRNRAQATNPACVVNPPSLACAPVSSLLLKGGRLIDPAHGLDETADLLLADGKVAAIGADAPGQAPEGTPELYFSDPDGLSIQLQDPSYCGGGGYLGEVC